MRNLGTVVASTVNGLNPQPRTPSGFLNMTFPGITQNPVLVIKADEATWIFFGTSRSSSCFKHSSQQV